ncbi:hypothetical protein CPLU01_06724 [Colletotrichum plurivorum]|uniref:Zn(2)-C6 fungal-type domain-containing protein n=1 Tax=Colletotrichum plurivorum TaxID=2175906 RepID=A0A8H6NFG1_9PEZI|nr:hypothetical protein CPLU01_06724 [Colletotrichum plurivorum]
MLRLMTPVTAVGWARPHSDTLTGTNANAAGLEPRHTTHRRLAPAPPPAPAAAPSTNSRHGDALRFPPSPSPTPSHPNVTIAPAVVGSNTPTPSTSLHNLPLTADRQTCRPPAAATITATSSSSSAATSQSKPGQCPVMALQNVLCDPDADAEAPRRSAPRPSQPPTPPMMHEASASIPVLPAPPPVPSSSLILNPIMSLPDPSEAMLVTRPNPSHVVMTTRPQLHPSRVQQSDPGCKTCQVRKMPCDEGRPTCQNCSRMGIHCLGYFNAPSHAQAQAMQSTDRSVPASSVAGTNGTPNGVNAAASRQEQEEYLYFLLDHYRHTKRHCMWDLITLDFNEHFSCKMRKEALQMIKRRRFKDRETREPSPNDPPSATQRPKAKRGRRPKFNPSTMAMNAQESRAEPSAG